MDEKKEVQSQLEGLSGKGDDDFVPSLDGSGSTKVEFDSEHNKALLEEMQKATSDGPTEEAPVEEKEEKSIEDMSDEEVNKEFVSGDDEEMDVPEEDIEKSEKFLSRIQHYIDNPDDLCFTKEEIDRIGKKLLSGMGGFGGGEETAESVAELIRSDVELIKQGIEEEKANPEAANIVYDKDEEGNLIPEDERPLNYANPKDREKAIRDSLKLRIATEEALASAEELTSPEFVMKIFSAKYPQYVEEGPAWIVKKFASYLKNGFDDRSNGVWDNFIRQVNSLTCIKHTLKRGDKMLFRHIKTVNGARYTAGHFIVSLLNWTKVPIAQEYGFKDEEVQLKTNKTIDSIMVVMSYFLIRFFYKKIVPHLGRNVFEKKLFLTFVHDENNQTLLDGKKVEDNTNAWKEVVRICHFLQEEATTSLSSTAQPKAN